MQIVKENKKTELTNNSRSDLLSKNGSRLNYVDVAKGIGILIVILQHTMANCGFSSGIRPLLAFHMPFFFLISGFLFKSKPASAYFSGKMKALLIPVVLTELFNFLIVRSFMNLIGYGKYLPSVSLGGQWFVYSLLYICCLHYIVNIYMQRKDNCWRRQIFPLLIFIASMVLGMVCAKMIDGSSLNIATAIVGYSFFLIGSSIKRLCDKFDIWRHIKKSPARIIIFVAGCLLFVGCCVFSFKNEWVFMYRSTYGNPVWFYVNALLGSFGVLFVSYAIQHNKILEFYGKNSLVVLYTHFPLFNLMTKALDVAGVTNEYLKLGITFVVILVLEFFIVKFCNRYLPVYTGKYHYGEN